MSIKKRIIRRLRKNLLKNGRILKEYPRPPEPFYPKGSYFVHFQSKDGNYMVGDTNKLRAYKSVFQSYNEIEKKINNKKE